MTDDHLADPWDRGVRPKSTGVPTRTPLRTTTHSEEGM